MFVNPFPSPFANPFPGMNMVQPQQPVQNQIPMMPEANLPKALNYLADQSGCGLWRMMWPSHVLMCHQKMTIHDFTIMNFHPQFFSCLKSIRIQRQATEPQLNFVKWLKDLSKQFGFRIIYEIDDIIFSEDIPEYNKYKPAFVDPNIRRIAQETMALCDEITVTCRFMKDYYHEKTGNSNITVVPNYPPKFWMGHYYNENKLRFNFDKYCTGKKTKPRILYPGSGAHFDVDNRVSQNDDFAHVREVIAKTAKEFQWVFIGAYPPPLHNFIKEGIIEFHPWKRILEYPQMIYDLNVNALIAPLIENNFNKAKSDLKFIEGCCYGLPVICQDLCTYGNAIYKFKTGPEMIDQIKLALKSGTEYMQHAKKVRKIAESRFLENDENIDKYVELYTLPCKDPGRKLLNSINL